MSDEAPKKRCPNMAWAFWTARRLRLPRFERWVFIAIAERAKLDLMCEPSQRDLAEDTGISIRSVQEALSGLLARSKNNEEELIEAENRGGKLRYRLLRPADVIKPAPHFPWHEPDEQKEAENGSDTQSARVGQPLPNEGVTQSARDTPTPDAQTARVAIRNLRASHIESLKTPPKEESPKEESSLRSERPPTRALTLTAPDNVVALQTKFDPQHIFDAWNAVAERYDLPRLRRPSAKARRRLEVLVRENGVDDVLAAIKAVGESPHCTGSNGWRADFYFMLRAEPFERLLSGFYADRPGRARPRAGTQAAVEKKYGFTPMQPTFDPEPDETLGRIAQ